MKMHPARKVTSAKELANVFGCSERHIRRFAADEGMPKARRGVYDFDACVRWRLSVLETRLAALSKPNREMKLDQERARKACIEADLKELALMERRGELVRLTQYRDVMAQMIATTRQNLLSLPSRVGHELLGLDASTMTDKLAAAIEKALANLQAPEMLKEHEARR